MTPKKVEPDQVLVLLAVKLVQPGRLADVAEGVARLVSPKVELSDLKRYVRRILHDLKEENLVVTYPVGRYLLSERGMTAVAASDAKANIDSRRFFLLKETRKRRPPSRSDTRIRSLEQWPS